MKYTQVMISEEERDKALKILEKYKEEQTHTVRFDIEQDCPSKEYTPIQKGEAQTGECESDGHYLCAGCKHVDLEHFKKLKSQQ